MSAAAQPASLPRTPSTSTRRQQPPPPLSYNERTDSRPHRTQSTASRSNNPAPSSPRRSTSQQPAPAQSHSRTPSNAQQRDFEQANANAARPSSSRRSESYDRPVMSNGSNPTRVESRRETGGGGHARTHSRYNEQPTPAPNTNGTTATEPSRSTNTAHGQPNLRRRTTIDATTGNWELGKTIGAGSMGKVKLARNKETNEHVAVKIVPRQSSEGEHRTVAERERADHSKEVRTAREAAIVTLVDHPYICGMRDVVRTNYHWYMLFEYVNGGQMLDYIISHGRLKEKQARKFARQVASALDYCHRNSIVHRDLKIENILISKTGDIKIIDFGLSNLFSPRSHLKTFCGSLYFAAPELLQAKQYTGPEVDVWSFGIVLYVLVCGKVPFDDQSMPQLHAKIKKGFVEYPPWLTPECRNLISRMLTTNPAERASLQEIMSHTWMTKGFNGAPDNYLPTRKPISLPLDESVIEKMTGFDFGDREVITSQLTKILESEEYQRAVKNAEKRNYQHQTPEVEQKRGGVFGFYKRRNSINSRDTLNTNPSTEAVQLGQDPVNAFHPLLSIYYLAQEKQEREAREKNPGALSLPQEPGEKPLQVSADLDMPATPKAAYTNSHAVEMAGEKPTGGRSRPRARTQGEDEVTEGLQGLNVGTAPNPTIVEPAEKGKAEAGGGRKESAAAGLLRRLSTRRNKDRLQGDASAGAVSGGGGEGRDRTHPPSSLAAYGGSGSGGQAAETPRKSFSVRRTREREPSATRPETSQGEKNPWLTPPTPSDGAAAEQRSASAPKKAHGLGRSISVNSSDVRRRLTRRGVSEGSSMRPPPMTSSSNYDQSEQFRREEAGAMSDVEPQQPRPQTGITSRARSMGHSRRESMQARRLRRNEARTSDVPEETDAEIQDENEGGNAGHGSPTGMKPVYLKGLFSVSTTSSRPLPVIRGDIIRVLKQLGVDYKEIRGGFSCRHAPSIMPSATADEQIAPSGAVLSPAGSSGAGHQRKISFGRLRNSDREDFRTGQQVPPNTPRTPAVKPSASYNTTNSEGDDDSDADEGPAVLSPKPTMSRPAGETTTHVQSDLGGNMVLKFEIFIVKVPLLSLHGIQFKKVDGGTWQYKNMAQTILNELRL